jgi:HPt (histidine-containing phosphotransfer) domain-containing protein
MAMGGRELIRAFMHRSSVAFALLAATLLVCAWLLLEQASRASEQAARALAGEAAARAALALRGEILTIEGRLRRAEHDGALVMGVSVGPLPAETARRLEGAVPGHLVFLPLEAEPAPEVLAALAPASPGAPTVSQRLPLSTREARLMPAQGAGLRLLTAQGVELVALAVPAGYGHAVRASHWVHEGSLRVEGVARAHGVPIFYWFIPVLGLFLIGVIFRQQQTMRERLQRKLGALRGSLARHAAQLSVNEARMRLTQAERVAAERRDAALVEAWPRPAALIDASERLCAWNAAFAALVPVGVLRRDLQLGMLLRHLDTRSGPRRRERGQRPQVRLTPMADGSRLIEGVVDQATPTNAGNEARRLCRAELESRAPLLREAVVAADAGAAKAQAHAMRGLASNFSLTEIASPLEWIERGAETQDVVAMAAGLNALDAHLEAALRQLDDQRAA